MSRTTSVCILDYGSGNVKSVANMISYLGFEVFISNSPELIQSSSHLILPGVGAFGSAVSRIKQSIPLPIVEREIFEKRKPLLGICVGMQVLADVGYEHGKHVGLGWIGGETVGVDAKGLPLPHMGWNEVNVLTAAPLFEGLGKDEHFYFVHSYALIAGAGCTVSSEVVYGTRFCASVQKENIYGVQFHPEKSQKSGLLLLRNFLTTK